MGMSEIPTEYRAVQILIPPPPDDPFWRRVRDFFKRHLNSIISHPVCAFFFAGAVACVLGVWLSNGDLFAMIPVLALGWIFAALGWWWAPNLSLPVRIIWIVVSAFPLSGEGYIVYWHFHDTEKPPQLFEGASVNFSIPPVEKMPDGSNILQIRVTNSGDTPMLNFSYHYAQSFSGRLLTVVEENDLFNEYVSSKFYPELEKATPEQRLPDDIFSSLVPGGYFELSQPNKEYNEDQIQQMTNEKLFVYDFLVVRYTDKLSMKKTYYYAEFCAQRLFIGNTINPCANHNFLKHPGK
jgi:hypothetical protein